MRTIDVSVPVFAAIWQNRREGEESENAILERILRVAQEIEARKWNSEMMAQGVTSRSKWWEIIEHSLGQIGGEGSLQEIYKSVDRVCREIGKRQPPSVEAAIRGTLEDNSSDSERFKHVRDIFTLSRGKHQGYWAIRKP